MEMMGEFAIGEDSLTGEIIGAAIEVHKSLGLGLLESAYEACLRYELSQRVFQKSYNILSACFYGFSDPVIDICNTKGHQGDQEYTMREKGRLRRNNCIF